jgi:tetratricopeptide (TPR) repeat protein
MPDLSTSTDLSGDPILGTSWENFDTILRHADRARSLQDRSRARTLYARLVELNPNDPRGWAGLGESASNSDEAIISWAYTLALAPNSWEARIQMDSHVQDRIATSGVADASVLLALARTLAEIGQKPNAYRLAAHATELDPTNVDGWLWRAGFAEDPGETIQCLRHVLSIDSKNAQAQAGLQWALNQQRSSPSANRPADARGAAECFEQGKLTLLNGNLADAHNLFVKATNLDPTHESAWFWRGSTAPSTADSLASMERTLRLNPHNQAAKDALWYLRVKKYRESFAARAAPPRALENTLPELSPSKRAPEHRTLKIILSVAVFFILVLLALVVAVWWRLSL